MSKTVQFCPLCGSERNIFFERYNFRGRDTLNRICSNCGLVFQSPCMDEEEAAAFYAAEYRLLNEGSLTPTARNVSTQNARADLLAGFARPMVGHPLTHLDIGCSMGILLRRFEKEFGCHPVGIEPGEAHRQHALQSGLTVYASLEELEQNYRSRFDLVSMAHVLEHLPDPVQYLIHLRESLLDPAGWLLLEVPNLYAHDSFETAHLVAYSAHTLQQTLGKAGFDVVRLKKHGKPRSDWLPLYISALARPHPGISTFHIQPERLVALKRRSGMLVRQLLERVFPGRAWNKEE